MEDDWLKTVRMTRKRITIRCPLFDAMFPAASDTTILILGRPAPETTGVVELSTALEFPQDSAVATPARLTLMHVGRVQFIFAPDKRRQMGCDETADTRTLHQRATPVPSVFAEVSPNSS